MEGAGGGLHWTLLLVEVLKAVAWPIVVVLLGWWMHEPVRKLLGSARPKTLKGPGFEVEMEKVEELVEAKVAQLPPPTTPLLPPITGRSDITLAPMTAEGTGTVSAPPPELVGAPKEVAPQPERVEADLVQYAPVGAIIAGWQKLEAIMRRAAARLSPTFDESARHVRPVDVVAALLSAGVLDGETLASVKSLQVIRNEAAHGTEEEITAARAARFLEVRDRIASLVEIGIDSVRHKQLLELLKVDSADKITVGRLLAGGTGASLEAARETARARAGKWGAKAGGITTMIFEDDARMLLRHGARYQEKPMVD